MLRLCVLIFLHFSGLLQKCWAYFSHRLSLVSTFLQFGSLLVAPLPEVEIAVTEIVKVGVGFEVRMLYTYEVSRQKSRKIHSCNPTIPTSVP